MTDRPTDGDRHRSPLARDVAVLVLAGIVLGVTFNALQAAQDSPRALAWVRREPKLASFESLVGTPAPGAPLAAAPADSTRGAAHASEPSARPATTASEPAAKAARAATATPAPTPATPAAPAPSPAGMPAQRAAEPVEVAAPNPAAALPVVPPTRDPLEVGLDFAKRFHAARGAVFVDARSATEYAEGHIAGAANLPFDDVYKKPELAKAFGSGGLPVIVYCGGGDCDLARSLAYSLIDAGHTRVLVFKDGFPAWTAAGLPAGKGATP